MADIAVTGLSVGSKSGRPTVSAPKRPRHRLVLVQTDDWVRAYVDGQFFDDGFSVERLGGGGNGLRYLLEKLGVQLDTVFVPADVWDEHLYENGYFDQLAANVYNKSETS